MRTERFRGRVEGLLDSAPAPEGGTARSLITVHHPGFYRRVLSQGSLGLGEAYMDGWWDCDRLDEFFYAILRADLDRRVVPMGTVLAALAGRLYNVQRPSRAFHIGRTHYDIGNDLYEIMLDREMIYSCAYWEEAGDLDAAQQAKLALTCRKLDLQPGMRVLDIGCGWGGMARYMAAHCDVTVVGITVSREQATLARERCRGLPVDIRLQDYRDLDGRFDRVVSIGMIEHVGFKNYRRFFSTVRGLMEPEGRFLLHTIGGNHSVTRTDRWIARYIFPDSMIPSIAQLGRAMEDRFVMEDWHGFGPDYDSTLMAWHDNVAAERKYLLAHYGERFYRMWTYYLLACAGSFRARKNQVWQILLSPEGIPGGYRAVRRPAQREMADAPRQVHE